MTNNNKIIPGMLDGGIEFFVDPDSKRVKTISSGKISDFTEVPFATIQILQDEIDRDIAVKLALLDMHPNKSFKRLEQFVRCRFGGLDYQADITNEAVQEGEYWDCPKRGQCTVEGILCKAVAINGARLSPKEVALAKRLSTDETNNTIAYALDLPMGSFHALKKKLYQKLGVRTKQELTILSHRHNLI